jgi:hypothetical protein
MIKAWIVSFSTTWIIYWIFVFTAYPYPVLVLASQNMIHRIKNLSSCNRSIVEYISRNFEDATSEQVKKAIRPYIDQWEAIRQKHLLNQLNQAAHKKSLAIGMKNVWRDAAGHKGRLLLVESDFTGTSGKASSEEIIETAMNPYFSFSYIKNAVDEVIEKILENGGDVELVDPGFLRQYGQIALIG